MVCPGSSDQTADCRDATKSGEMWVPAPLIAGTVTGGAVSSDLGAALAAATGGETQILAIR